MITDVQPTPPADQDSIVLTYTHRQWASGDDGPEVWHVSADAHGDGDEPVSHVGDIEIVLVDPDDSRNSFALLDDHDLDLGVIAETVLDPSTGRLRADFTDRLEPVGSRLLILNRAELAADWRGFGIGVLLAGLAIERLAGGCQAALCYPAPLNAADDEDPARRQAAVEALGEVWSQLGFEHFRNGVHVVDLAFVTLGEAIERLRERFLEYA